MFVCFLKNERSDLGRTENTGKRFAGESKALVDKSGGRVTPVGRAAPMGEGKRGRGKLEEEVGRSESHPLCFPLGL